MSDIFISYANEDRPRARALAEALKGYGWTVWWDRSIPFGRPFDEVIEAELDAASCVIVVWSEHSVRSDYVRDEVDDAREHRRLVPVVVDDVKPPLGFRRLHAANLGAWKPGESLPVFDKLVADVTAIIGQPRAAGAGGEGRSQEVDTAASEAEAVLTPPQARPEPPAIQDIHGWPADTVRNLQARTAAALGIPVSFEDALRDGGKGPEIVVIPAGRFLMGSPEDEPERDSDERQHEVTIERPFGIGRYEVTFEDYDRFAAATGREKPDDEAWGRGRRPAINVSWEDAVAYAEWLSQQTGHEYRLPTEAEWEYAARAGTTTPFHFGATITTDQANYDGNYTYAGGPKGEYREQTLEVGSFPANAWGLHDVHGNVFEWTCSEYDSEYGGAESRCRSKNRANGASLVFRGGSWDDLPRRLRAAGRFRWSPSVRYHGVGFRLARTLTI